MKRKKILHVVGARPNFVKLAPLLEAYHHHPVIQPLVLHTRQHTDKRLSDVFFNQLRMPLPDIVLQARKNGIHAQFGSIIAQLEPILKKIIPDLVVVFGDVTSTIATALAAAYSHIPIAHIEAGLRSFDSSMPEEINRITTDHLADLLFVSEQSGVQNLIREGINEKKIHLVGNIMIDTIEKNKKAIYTASLRAPRGPFIVATLHRPCNVDQKGSLKKNLRLLSSISTQTKLPVFFPLHPRTQKRINAFGLQKLCGKISFIPPLGYIDFLALISRSTAIITDSGGIQSEATWFNIPCLTLRTTTEHHSTVQRGTNTLVACDKNSILEEINKIQNGSYKKTKRIPFWDGKTGLRIAKCIANHL